MPSCPTTGSILIVEDDPQLCNNMALILSLEDFEVRVAHNGSIGLQLIEEKQPDLILCDILMPGMDGHAFHENIKQHPDWASILFIFVSALNDQSHVRRGMLAGADDYLPKPFSAEELLTAVKVRLMRRHLICVTEPSSIPPLPTEAIPKEQALLLQRISRREREVLLLVAQGDTTKEIANQLFISPKTVEAHRSQLMKKLGATNAAALARWASLLEPWPHSS
ncbi:MAG: response regulator transcription factor [Desulfobulbus sp.]|nr:response regulator transcription factor [Desulfobulbus sp.]